MARLPYQKTLVEFGFAFQPSVDKKLIDKLATMNFIRQAANVVFLGSPGVGKSHLAIALAVEALTKSISVYFTRPLRSSWKNSGVPIMLIIWMRKCVNTCDRGF